MKHLLLFSFVCLSNAFGIAHESNEAFFDIIQKENTIEIRAEFPFAMRNALMTFNPSLENATSKKDFENTFIEYIKTNLILKDKNGNELKYQEYKELKNNGHSHQNNYLIVFKGNDLYEITNTIMFNVFTDQVNYHNIIINSKQIKFKTKEGQTHFTLKKNTKYWWLLFLFIPLVFILIRYLIKNMSKIII
jgi:hypothetical protein